MNYTAKQIAKQRIQVLFEYAVEIHAYNGELSRGYIKTALKIAMAARLGLPQKYKRQICKNCSDLLISGVTCRVRIQPRREPHVVTTCLGCGWQTRIPIRQKKMEIRKVEQNNNKNEASCAT